MRPLVVTLLAAASLSAAQCTQTSTGTMTFTGTITDDMCPMADHTQMQMGPTDAECVTACRYAHGAKYVLYDGKDAYTLSDQETPSKFAAQKVQVTGTLDAPTKTINVESITATK